MYQPQSKKHENELQKTSQNQAQEINILKAEKTLLQNVQKESNMLEREASSLRVTVAKVQEMSLIERILFGFEAYSSKKEPLP